MENLFSEKLIKVPLEGQTKTDVIRELTDLLFENGRITNKQKFVEDVLERERQLSTTLDNGICIPHARSDVVTESSIAIGVSKTGIDCGSMDRKSTKIFVLIASPKEANSEHINTLSMIASKLLDDSIRTGVMQAESEEMIYNLLTSNSKKNIQPVKSDKFLIGVTGCAAGIAHTYLAAKSLVKAANEIGVNIKVETNGSIGVENSPSEKEIEKAAAIIIASDKKVDMERFSGKQIIITGVKKAIDEPEKLIEQALTGKAPVYSSINNNITDVSSNNTLKDKASLYKYLMNGVSYMIPFVVFGGILIALSLAIGGEPTPNGLQIPEGSVWEKLLNVGSVGFNLMIPILAGYIAFAIGDRAALAPGMIGGYIANDGSFYGAEAGAGFIGAILAGFLAGYLVKWIKTWKFPEIIQPLVPIMIIPIIASTAIALIFIFVIGAPISSLMDSLVQLLRSMSSGSLVLIGIVIGLMQGFDMGGPFGKVAFMFSVGLIASGETQFMGAQAVAIPVAPLGMCLATIIGRKMNIFNQEEIANGKAAGAMGLVGISEGAIPFAASDPLAVIPANMIGSAVGAVLGFLFGITDNVAHGGPIVALLGAINKPFLALLAMAIGSVVTALITIGLKKVVTRRVSKKNSNVANAI